MFKLIKHTVTKIPEEITKQVILRAFTVLISSSLFTGMSFLLQLGKEQILAGNIVIGLILVTLYFVRNTLHSFFDIWQSNVQENFEEILENSMNNRIASLLLKTRDRIWVHNDKTNSNEIMSTNAILHSSKQYIRKLWMFKTNLPLDMISIITTLVGFIGFILVSSVEIEHTLLFIIIIIIASSFSMLFARKRVHTRQITIGKQREIWKHNDELLNDIINIEPISEDHEKYMVNNFINSNMEALSYGKASRIKTKIFDFCDSLFGAIATITIIGIKLWETGISNVDLEVVLSIVALMGIYNSIMDSINCIIRDIEHSASNITSIKEYQIDFQKIVDALDSINDIDQQKAKLSGIIVDDFAVQYQAINNENPFSLENHHHISFKLNDLVLLTGPTGSGKSTFMKMLTKKVTFDSFEPNFVATSEGSVETIMHQTDGRLGCNSVLSELTLGKELDEDKLYYILKGLHLFEEISAKNKNVATYLAQSKIQQFSSGQKQRLAIARLLYNINDSVQIIGFDEATNALNDAITLQTLQFVKNYCKDKILLVATHQVDIGSTVATQILEFAPDGNHYAIKQK